MVKPNIKAAFRDYEALRQKRTASIVQQSRRMGVIGQWQHPLAVALRNRLIKLLPTSLTEKNSKFIFSYQA